MINADMRQYDYYKTVLNAEYGQELIPAKDTEPLGTVKMAIYPTSAGTQDNILYSNCSYVGMTFDAEINDRYIVLKEEERLKVMYIQHKGRFKQVFLKKVD